jgi:hypothetical protein
MDEAVQAVVAPAGVAEVLVAAYLRKLLGGLGTEQGRIRRAVKGLIQRFPGPFLRALDELRGLGDEASHLGGALAVEPELLVRLCEPEHLKLSAAAGLLRWLSDFEPSVSARMAREVIGLASTTPANLVRMIDMLDAAGSIDNIRPLLVSLFRHPDKRVRSKVALLMSRRRGDLRIDERRLSDPDPRVRANTVEGLWGLEGEEPVRLFRRMTLDSHHRVVANALVALHMAGERDEAAVDLERMGHSSRPEFRAAAAWAMGRLGAATFVPQLKKLAEDHEMTVRSAAVRALVALNRNQQSSSQTSPPPSE